MTKEKEAPSLVLFGDGGQGAMLEPDSFRLADQNHNDRAVLGLTQLEMTKTGEVRTRAASSLVLFDKDGKVLWSAP
jgi:hypothetical protein